MFGLGHFVDGDLFWSYFMSAEVLPTNLRNLPCAVGAHSTFQLPDRFSIGRALSLAACVQHPALEGSGPAVGGMKVLDLSGNPRLVGPAALEAERAGCPVLRCR